MINYLSKIKMGKIVKNNLGNFLVILVIFSMVTVWFFSGWPKILDFQVNEGKIVFPPEIPEAQAAITIVATTTGQATKSTSLTISNHTVSGTNVVLYVFISAATKLTGAGTQEPDSVVWQATGGDQTLTQIAFRNDNKWATMIYRYINPTADTANILISDASNNWSWNGAVAAAVTVSGVNQTTPNDTPQEASGSVSPATVNVSSETGDLVLDTVAVNNKNGGTCTPAGGDQTEQWDVIQKNIDGCGSSADGAGTVTMDWTLGADVNWGITAININQAAVAAATYEQSAYRWFENLNSTQVGATTTAAQDASTTLAATGDEFRLRMLLHVSTATSTAGADNLKLQVATSTPGSCSYDLSNYNDVAAASGDIRYFNNSSPSDGDLLTATGTDPAHGGDTVINQTYEEANNFTATTTIGIGQDGLWDFALDDFSAPANTTYCFRVVYADNSLISTSTNTKIPEITSAPPTTTLTQNYYRFYENKDDVQPDTPKATEINPANVVGNEVIRIRMSINVTSTALATSTKAFKLQHGTTTNGCSAVSIWEDVGATSSSVIWRGYDNPSVADGTNTTALLLSVSDVLETYEEANPSASNTNAIAVGEDGEWDWVVQENGASVSSDYCFRMVESDSAELNGGYTYYPRVTVVPPPELHQNYYRWRDDSATLDTDSGWLAATNTTTTINKVTTTRLRVEIANSTTSASADNYIYQIEYAGKVGATCGDNESFSAIPINTATEHFEMATSSQYNNGSSTTVSLLPATNTWTNGLGVADPNSTSSAFSLATSTYTEFEYAIQATTYASTSQAYCFRITNNGTTTNFTYDVYPELSVVAPVGVTISGTVYTDEGTTTSTAGSIVSLAVNSTWTASTTASTTDGSYSFSDVTIGAAGDAVTVYLDDSSEKGVTITRASSTSDNITGLDLYQNRIIARHKDSGPITIDDLAKYDSDDDGDILFTAASSTGVLAASSTSEFFVWSGDTFGNWGAGGVAGTTTLSDVDINGTFTATSTQTISVACNGGFTGANCWDATGGIFNSASSTIEFTSTATGKTITVNNNPFWNLTFNGTGGEWTFQDAATTTNDLTIMAGTASSTYDMTVLGGDVTGNGTLNWTGSTFLLDGTGNFGGTSAWDFYALTFGDGVGAASTTAGSTGTTTISNVLTIAANQELYAGSITWTLSGSGTPLVINGTFLAQTSLFKYTALANTTTTAATYNNLELSPSGAGSPTYYLSSGTLTTNGYLTIGDGTNPVTVTADVNDPILDVIGNYTISANATSTASASAGFSVGGNWSNAGTFNHSNGTVVFDATSTGKTISDGGWPFYLITFNGSGGGWLYQDSTSTEPATTTVQAGTATFLNAKTGGVSVTGGTLNVDWYLGIHVVDRDATSTDIDTGDNDITISENTASSSVWRWDGTIWQGPYNSTTTGTLSSGLIPPPASTTAGAIRIREYSKTSVSTAYYKYNSQITSQAGFSPYNYFADFGSNYLISTSSPEVSGVDKVIYENWHRAVPGTMNSPYTCPEGSGDQCVNNAPTNGSWYIGMISDLEFSLDSLSVDLGNLFSGNNWTATATTITYATTSATNGYVITAWAANDGQLATGSYFIARWDAFNATPTDWSGNCQDNSQCGFGYRTDDYALSPPGAADRFSTTTLYAGFATSSAATDPVADASGPVSGDEHIITYKVSVSNLQEAEVYQTSIYYIATAQY